MGVLASGVGSLAERKVSWIQVTFTRRWLRHFYCNDVINQAPNLNMLGLLQMIFIGFAAGLMLSISFFDLAHSATNSLGFFKGNLWSFACVIFFAIVANFIPEPTLAPTSDEKRRKKNEDEGSKGHQASPSSFIQWDNYSHRALMLVLTWRWPLHFCIASQRVLLLHSLFIFPHSKREAFKLPSLSGFAEPLGVIIVVGGGMAFLTLHEVMPLAFDYAGWKQSIKDVFCGMAFMFASLSVILPEDMRL